MIIKDVFVKGRWWGSFIPRDSEDYIKRMLEALPKYYDTEDIKIVEREV